ncbi:tail protein X [Meridianimarinicoccus sp. RP-17]|uniref:tail protein X n=1 Tax=Meridianimarinicoccus zhengii TaxID=2056810 RepID=UPI001F479B56|nr:tail protein X [Phycocomes zhengii]
MVYYRSREGEVLDEIIRHHYGRQDQGLLVRVLEANRNLADLDIILPEGTRIALPVVDAADPNPVVRLWS